MQALIRQTDRFILLEEGDIAEITLDGCRVYDAEGSPVERSSEEVTWDADAAEKGGYETFMLKEIHEQADAVAETIADRLPGDESVDLSELDLNSIANLDGIVVRCLDQTEIGLELGYLTSNEVRARADALGKTDYASYLRRRAQELDDA